MPIVDVRNQPTVIEIGPGAMVAEFTEELVTAQVLVGPTVVEFSWGELIPGPGLKGGGPFEGTVYIDQDIPGLPPTVEGIDPNEDLFMMWDESQQKHVKVPASSGGGLLDLDNIGAGAEVYKNTTDHIAHLRTLVGKNAVTVTQQDEEIWISANTGGGGAVGGIGESTEYIGKAPTTCGHSTSINPESAYGTGALQSGDLMIWCAYYQVDTYTQSVGGGEYNDWKAHLLIPSGWTQLVQGNLRTIQGGGLNIFYKFLTNADITATHTVSSNDAFSEGTPHRHIVCGHTMVFRNVHRDIPFGGFSRVVDGNRYTEGFGNPIPITSTEQHVLHLWRTANNGASSWPLNNRIGPAADDSWYGSVGDGVSWTKYHYKCDIRKATLLDEENWIAGETRTLSGGGSGWTSSGLLYSSQAGGQRSMYTNNRASNGRAYLEYEVTLVAGETYTLSVLSSGDYDGMNRVFQPLGVSIVDPSSVERGAIWATQGGPGWNYTSGSINDPSSDYGTVWSVTQYNLTSNGVPGRGGGYAVIFFTAPTSGVHKIRLSTAIHYQYPSNSQIWSNVLNSTVGSYFQISNVCFRRGKVAPTSTYTPNGPVFGGTLSGHTPAVGYLGAGTSWQYWQLALNSNILTFPPVKMSGLATGIGEGDSYISADGLTGGWCGRSSSDAQTPLIATRPVYRSLTDGGPAARYYYEVTLQSGTWGGVGFMLGDGCRESTGASSQYYINLFGNQFAWPNNNTPSSNTATLGAAFVAGDVAGISLDYQAKTITVYRNGTSVGTFALLSSYPQQFVSQSQDGSRTGTDPMWAIAICGGCTMRFNFRGPFKYALPANHVAYDWKNQAGGSPIVGITTDTTGLPLAYNLDTESPTIKSVVAGSNIKLTDQGGSILVDALKEDFYLQGSVDNTMPTWSTNWAPSVTGKSTVRCALTGNTDLYKITTAANDKRLLYIINTSGTYTITIKHNQDGGGGGYSGHQIYTPGGVDFIIRPYGGALLRYDASLPGGGKYTVIAA